jgi:hypothetical protein
MRSRGWDPPQARPIPASCALRPASVRWLPGSPPAWMGSTMTKRWFQKCCWGPSGGPAQSVARFLKPPQGGRLPQGRARDPDAGQLGVEEGVERGRGRAWWSCSPVDGWRGKLLPSSVLGERLPLWARLATLSLDHGHSLGVASLSGWVALATSMPARRNATSEARLAQRHRPSKRAERIPKLGYERVVSELHGTNIQHPTLSAFGSSSATGRVLFLIRSAEPRRSCACQPV